MADEVLGTGSVVITIDDSAADAGLDRLADKIETELTQAARDGARRMERVLNAAIRKISPLRLEITADTRRFRAALNELNNIGSTPLRVVPEVNREEFVRRVQYRLRGAEVSIRVVPDFTELRDRIRAFRAPAIDVPLNVNTRGATKAINTLGKALKSVGGIAGITLAIGGLGIAAASAASSIASLVAALAPAAGIVAALPAVVLGAAGAIAGLRIALSGVGDAFGEALTGDAKAFEKSLKGLSPAAKEAAREVRAMKPEFERLKQTIQERFFVQIEGDIGKTAKALAGPLRRGLANVAIEWGRAASNALDYVRGTKGIENIRDILFASDAAVGGLADGANKLTAGFLQAGAVIAKTFGQDLGNAISARTQQFGTFLQTAAGDGRLQTWVSEAIFVFQQLGAILGNIGGVLTGVFQAAGVAGGGFLENIRLITQQMQTFVESARGQEALVNIFRALASVAAQLAPILSSIVQVLGQIAPALVPLFNAIGPAIVNVINALGPAIQALLPGITSVVEAIVTALNSIAASGVLTSIGEAFGTVLNAVAPLIPVIGDLVTAIGTALAPVVTALATALAPVIQAIAGALTPILPPLVNVILQVVEAFNPLVQILGAELANIITALAPVLTTLADVFGTLATALAPLITQLVDGLAPIIESIAPIVTRLVEAITPLIVQLVDALLPVLPPIIDAFLAILEALTPLTEPVVQLVEALAPLVALIISALAPVIQFAAEVLKWVAINGVVPFIQQVIDILTEIITTVTNVITSIVTFVDDVKQGFTDFKDNTIQTVALWIVAIREFFNRMKEDASQRVRELVDNTVRFFTELPGKAKAALSTLGTNLLQAVQSAAQSLNRRVQQMVTDAANFVRELPGKAKAALGNLGSFLYSAGEDLIRGMINGVKAMAGNIADAAVDVVKGAVDSAKDFLGIASPSKLFFQVGEFSGQGLVNGFDAMAADVRETAKNMASNLTSTFAAVAPQGLASTATGRALGAVADPFGTQTATAQSSAVTRPSTGPAIVNNITINEVSDAETTARRVLNRLALEAGVL